jgi:non-heme chloroperoxidase
MNRTFGWLATTALLFGGSAFGQDLTGAWQATVQPGAQPLRVIVKLKKSNDGGWTGTLYSVDQGSDWGAGSPVSAVVFDGKSVSFVVEAQRGKFQGTLSADGGTLEGTWTQRQPVSIALRRATPETAWKDPATHTIQFISVDKDVKLEVLDWGGSGPPLVFLAGLGNTAHVFDKFAPKFLASRHVYGITRRGFGDSSVPPDGYAADRLGDDVLAVLDALKIMKPVLVGHSLAGEEMSSIASRHPDRVSGLVYLDAGYWYAFYDAARGALDQDALELRRKIEQLIIGPTDKRPLIKELLETDLPRFERDLQVTKKDQDATPPALLAGPGPTNVPMQMRAIAYGSQKYANLSSVPILAIYAVPHDPGPLFANVDPALRAAQIARDETTTNAQAAAFEKGVPSAKVVRIPNANHYVFRSNEEDVLREMNSFLAGIK